MMPNLFFLFTFFFYFFFSTHVNAQDLQPDSSNSNSTAPSPSLNVQDQLKQHIHWNKDSPNQIGYLYVGGHENSINESTWLYIKQGLDHYKTTRPIFIILEIDTPGGEVFAAQKISEALKEMDTQYGIPVVAYINNWAISAGAMLAYACRFITTVKDGSMGAAEPVLAGEGGMMESASEKINSALRSDFASRAAFFDRNPLIAEAMVDKDLIIVMREGKIIKLDREDQINYTAPHADIIISPKGKLLTLDATKMMEYHVADLLLLPKKLPALTAEEKKSGVWPSEKVLLLQEPFFSTIPQATVQVYEMDWKTHLFVFLATPWVASLLFMGLIIGAYLEFQSPGLTLPGLVAGSCLFLIALSSFALELGSWLEIIFLLTGLALILTELFIFPTLGILLLMGGVLFLGGLFALLLPGFDSVSFESDAQTLNAAGQFVLERLAWLFGAFILSVLIIILFSRYFLPKSKALNRFVLAGHEQDASKGFIANDAPATLPQPGTEGTVWATLRPAGKIMVAGQVYDAMSYGGFIEADEKIVVLRLDGSTIIVACKEGELN